MRTSKVRTTFLSMTAVITMVLINLTAKAQCWNYRKTLLIDNTQNKETLENYQVKIEFDSQALISAGKMQVDGSDIRFSRDTDGSNPLPYWIQEGINDVGTIIWVKTEEIAGNSLDSIYMFYGDSLADARSHGELTFPFFDDFLDNRLNEHKWERVGTGLQQEDHQGGVYTATVTSSWRVFCGIKAKVAFPKGKAVGAFLENVGNMGDYNGSFNGFFSKDDSITANCCIAGQDYAGILNSYTKLCTGYTAFWYAHFQQSDSTVRDCYNTEQVPYNGGYYHTEVKVREDGTGIDYFIPQAQHTVVNSIPNDSLSPTFILTHDWNGGTNATMNIDWVYVREYSYPEPSAMLQQEVTIDPCVNVTGNAGKRKKNMKVNIFPNPAKDNISISIEMDQRKEVVINMYTLMGHKIIEQRRKGEIGSSNFIVNIEQFPPGTYFVEVISKDKREVKRVLKY